MPTPKLLFACLAALVCLARPAPAAPLYDSAGTTAAAQDATGTVWAVPALAGGSSDDGKISRWQGGDWVTQSVPEAAGFRPLTLTRSPDGCVYALWQKTDQGRPDPQHWLVTVLRGRSLRVLAGFAGPVAGASGFSSVPALSAGAAGDVWVSGTQPVLRRITAAGILQVFPLKADWYTNGKIPADNLPSSGLASLTDSAGRRWFWQDQSRGGWQPDSLRGVLVWNGKTLEHPPLLTGAKSERVSLLAPQDAAHFWLALGTDYAHGPPRPGGLFMLDTRTLTAVPEPTPPAPARQAEAFQTVAQLFQSGSDWYLTAQDFSHQTVSVWCRRQGVWQEAVPVLEAAGGYFSQLSRFPWLAEPSGTWLGAGGGAWWLPRSGRPALWVNWRRGVRVVNAAGLFPLPSGRVLVFGQNTGTAEMPPTPQPVRPLPPGVSVGGLGAPGFFVPPLADSRRHLWVQTYDGGNSALAEWDGRQWHPHRVPKTIEGAGGLYACDTHGRLWIMTSVWHPPAHPQPVEGRALYDPARDTWTSYATVPEALAASAALPGMGFQPYRNTYNPPVFSGDGRVAYSDQAGGALRVVLYDGKAWRHWQTGEILTNYAGNVPNLVHFNAAGHLEIGFSGLLCEWTPETGWQRNGEQNAAKYEDPVPPGGPHGLWGSPVTDDVGVKWFTWNGDVYTAGYGLWVKQTALSAPGSPFRLGFGIETVLRDPAGRLFFASTPAGHPTLVVWTPPAAAKPALAVQPTSDDAVRVRVQSALTAPPRYLWRLNGGAWSGPSTAAAQVFAGLPRGDYKMEVQTLDARLQLSPTASALWSIRAEPSAQIARWIAALQTGPDTAREAAVAGLVQQPQAARAALQAARPGASDLGRWWIDAAMQQITAQEKTAGVSGGSRE